jgi:phospholipase/carboxylesterase
VLADFIGDASTRYNFTRAPIAIGFSNGAIMAAALLLTRPGLLGGAILFRPLSPFRDDPSARLDGAPALIIDGERASRRSPGDGARLADPLARAGGSVSQCTIGVKMLTTSSRHRAAQQPMSVISPEQCTSDGESRRAICTLSVTDES